LGDFKNTVTVGVISAIGRSIEISQNYQMEGLIQTDAAINQGNSGGPLVNLAGEVIGINTLIVRGNGYGSAVAEGLGFSIPANTVRAISQQLIENGFVAYPYLGIRWQWITPNIAYRYGLPVESGAYISNIEPDSPAASVGLQAGDIITRIGDQWLDAEHPFINVLYDFTAGETTSLEFIRGQETLNVEITLGEHPNP
jgi:2-alkenal reductase